MTNASSDRLTALAAARYGPVWTIGRIDVPDVSAVEAMRRCPLFTRAGDGLLESIAAGMRKRRFRRGEVVFHQGDPGDSLHVVVSGSVKVVLPSPEGEEAIIATLGPTDFFGELALLDGGPRSATVMAVEATETMSLSRASFLDLIGRNDDLRRALLAGLATELRRLTGHVEELHFLDLPGRLALRIARLARERAPEAAGEVRLDWPFTQADLASMIGGTRQTVNKLLSEFVDDGLLVIDRNSLLITDVRRLERRAQL